VASGTAAFSQGECSIASGIYSVAEGYHTEASGRTSHAEGRGTKAAGDYSHAEGYYTTASGNLGAHAEGYQTTASNEASHAQGYNTTAEGKYSHAEGYGSLASGFAAHAQGVNTQAIGYATFAGNTQNIAQNDYQTVIGRRNAPTDPALNQTALSDAFIIGNGDNDIRRNAFRITFQGNVYSATGSYTSGADYAEMFEWQDGNPHNEDRRGYFVTLQDGLIRKAENSSQYILGVVSATPSIVGDSHGTGWHNMHLRDDFGAVIYGLDEKGIKLSPVLNPDYDPTRLYTPRNERKEWAAIGMMGKLIVRDDGTCKPNGFCTVATGGMATTSQAGYIVMERISESLIRIVIL